MKPRILVIDDEEVWQENYQAWIPKEIAEQDPALSAAEAVELLRKRKYELVLLDLSMDVNDPTNRDNKPIQEYLANQPEGTLYIVVSGTAEKMDVRDLAFKYHAYDLIFKAEIEPAIIREKVAKAIDHSLVRTQNLPIEARRKMMPSQVIEHKIMETIKPGGAEGLYKIMDTFLAYIAPLVPHQSRPSFDIFGNCILGLVWSRQLGKAVSILLNDKEMMTEEQAQEQLTNWLGYAPQQPPLFLLELDNVQIRVFEEPNISDAHFDLPVITLS